MQSWRLCTSIQGGVGDLADACSVTSSEGFSNIDWKDGDALRALTRALLKEDWDFEVDLPEDRLCPTVGLSRSQHGVELMGVRYLTGMSHFSPRSTEW